MTDQLIQEYLANGGKVTSCPPAHAKGNEASLGTKQAVKEAKAKYRAERRAEKE
jgi:hypothetical protein